MILILQIASGIVLAVLALRYLSLVLGIAILAGVVALLVLSAVLAIRHIDFIPFAFGVALLCGMAVASIAKCVSSLRIAARQRTLQRTIRSAARTALGASVLVAVYILPWPLLIIGLDAGMGVSPTQRAFMVLGGLVCVFALIGFRRHPRALQLLLGRTTQQFPTSDM